MQRITNKAYRILIKGLCTLMIVMSSCIAIYAQKLTVQQLNQQKEDAQARLANTKVLIEQANRDKAVSTQKLELLNSQLQSQNDLIATLEAQVELATHKVSYTQEQIHVLQNSIQELKEQYAQFLRAIQFKRKKEHILITILASRDMAQLYRRLRFLREYSDFRRAQYDTIQAKELKLQSELQVLTQEKTRLLHLQAESLQAKQELEDQRTDYDNEVQRLLQRGTELEKQLQQDQQKIEKLNQAINKLLEEEAAQHKKLKKDAQYKEHTKFFASQKGKLLWPLNQGVITRGYGKQASQLFKGVKTNSQGVDISVTKQANVQAVAPGVVTKIARIAGANAVVIVRHGEFLTLYSNLSSVSVRTGDVVVQGTTLGQVYYESANQQASLHFEIWKGFKSQNPRLWLRP